MKKCASCSKDLPEAALHCVFCGAKQAPAPAVQPSAVAKTAFGYSANEVLQQLGKPPAQPAPQPPPAQVAPQPAPVRPNPGSQPPPHGYAPQAAATAPTMYAPAPASPPGPAPGYGGSPAHASPPAHGAPAPGFAPQPGPLPANAAARDFAPPPASAPSPSYAPPPAQPAPGMGIHSPQQATPAPLPAVPQPYLGAQTGVARSGRPIEPWRETLRVMMFVWGVVLLASFATPLSTDPMAFQWDLIIDGAGTAKVPPLVWAGAGLLSLVFAAVPMAALPRGVLAAVLGLAGIFVPKAIAGSFGEWTSILFLVGGLALVPGLLLRHEYVESTLARILVTVGVVATLIPYLVPNGGQIPLVGLIQALLRAGSGMEVVIIALAQIVLAVLCLLVWMPGPATAGAKIFAWAVLLFPVAAFVLTLLGAGHVGDAISKTPGQVVSWAPGVSYSVLFGYGLATVLGKQLE